MLSVKKTIMTGRLSEHFQISKHKLDEIFSRRLVVTRADISQSRRTSKSKPLESPGVVAYPNRLNALSIQSLLEQINRKSSQTNQRNLEIRYHFLRPIFDFPVKNKLLTYKDIKVLVWSYGIQI